MGDGAGGVHLLHPERQTSQNKHQCTKYQNSSTVLILTTLFLPETTYKTLNIVFYTEAVKQGLPQNLGPDHQAATYPLVLFMFPHTLPSAAACYYSIST